MLLLAVISVFALAFVAPWVHRVAPRAAGWGLAVLPAGLTVHFAHLLAKAAAGEIAVERHRWLPALGIELAFSGDGLGTLFATAIAGVGTIIVVYTGAYLHGHPRQGRFFAYILAFMGSMLGVALADDLFALFVFWELTSLTSYLLIGFECQKQGSSESAQQALIVTAGGGLALLAGFILLGQAAGTSSISEIVAGGALHDHALYLPILLLVAAGAFTKSAQFPFHFWLPNAMVAPTPVSAYLHSATMVKVGIYLLARLSPVLAGTDTWRWLLTGAGAVTMVLGAGLALSQRDLKRQLAFATLSVLGTLTLLLGHGSEAAVGAAMVLFVAHAGYKGGLFLVVGSIDHEVGTRDVMKLGGLARRMPITAAAGVVGALSMAGIPPLIGFVSKEVLYEALEPVALLLGAAVVAKILSVTVAATVGVRPFFGKPRGDRGHEAPLAMWLGPVVLAAVGLVAGLGAGPTSRLLAAAAGAVRPGADVDLALWHGVNTAFVLSVITVATGLVLFAVRDRVVALLSPLRVLARWGPERGYAVGDASVNLLARASTGLLQHGYLRHYVGVIIVATVGLAGLAFFRDGWPLVGHPGGPDPRVHEVAVAIMVVCGAGATAVLDSRIAAVAALGAVGYGVALFFVLLGAPDLAITQFSIETLTVLLFLIVVYRLPPYVPGSSRASRVRDALVAGAAGVFVTFLVLAATAVHQDSQVSQWFAANSEPLAKGRNVVNVILVDFRALDTLGEITVLAVAGIGVFSLMKLRLGDERADAAGAGRGATKRGRRTKRRKGAKGTPTTKRTPAAKRTGGRTP